MGNIYKLEDKITVVAQGIKSIQIAIANRNKHMVMMTACMISAQPIITASHALKYGSVQVSYIHSSNRSLHSVGVALASYIQCI